MQSLSRPSQRGFSGRAVPLGFLHQGVKSFFSTSSSNSVSWLVGGGVHRKPAFIHTNNWGGAGQEPLVSKVGQVPQVSKTGYCGQEPLVSKGEQELQVSNAGPESQVSFCRFVTHAGREPQDHRTVCCKTGTTSLLLQDRNRRSVYCRTGTTSRYCRTVTASLYSAGQEPQVCYCRAGTAGLYTAGQEPQVRYCRTGSAIMYTAGQETFWRAG